MPLSYGSMGCVWTTDKDGIVASLLPPKLPRAAEAPAELYRELTRELGEACNRPRRSGGDA